MHVLVIVVSGLGSVLMLVGPHLAWTQRRLARQHGGDRKSMRQHMQLMYISGATMAAVCVVNLLRLISSR